MIALTIFIHRETRGTLSIETTATKEEPVSPMELQMVQMTATMAEEAFLLVQKAQGAGIILTKEGIAERAREVAQEHIEQWRKDGLM